MRYIEPEWPAPAQIKAFTTTKTAYDNTDRSKIHTAIALPGDPFWINQIHGATVVEACSSNLDSDADAIYTAHPNRICAVLTADCLPILLCSRVFTPNYTMVAAIHAGWRGLSQGIIEATLQAMHYPPNELMAWLGPAIGSEKFEVGKDVYTAFTHQHPEAAQAFQSHQPEKWLADLYKLARIRLHALGIQQIYGGQYCTYTQEALFYSYRRDPTNIGRMVTGIWIAQAS